MHNMKFYCLLPPSESYTLVGVFDMKNLMIRVHWFVFNFKNGIFPGVFNKNTIFIGKCKKGFGILF
jgi:hypothetical protein